MPRQTLLVGLAHPDDELPVAGTILAQRARGDRVVIVWLTRGEMTEAFGPIPSEEVAERRVEQGRRAAEILRAETRFLDYEDTRLVASPEAAARVARVIADIRPDGLLTWGDAWVRGVRHPDHLACGKIFRDAITLARVAKVVAPGEPHRAAVPIFTVRDVHSTLPAVVVDVEPHLEGIRELARFYWEGVGFGNWEWIERRLTNAGAASGLRYAEAFDAWETQPGAVTSLFPAEPLQPAHPDRRSETATRAGGGADQR
ncbi:MAG TPA: PIG-L family deacetylase [Longimicrobiaceae bacterium]|nr:PIG-L family deacetylase [Longimicrobiaceae bacterium]